MAFSGKDDEQQKISRKYFFRIYCQPYLPVRIKRRQQDKPLAKYKIKKAKENKEEKNMKKLISTLLVLTLILTVGATAALAEETAPRSFISGVQFNMDMEQVTAAIEVPNYKIEKEITRGNVEFWELEYEDVKGEDGFTADLKFLFVGNGLVAIHYDMEEGTDYNAVKEQLVQTFGEATPFDAAKIGNGKFAIDDDGDLKDCVEMIEAEGVTIVLEKDHEGDMDVTFLDPTAAYINN